MASKRTTLIQGRSSRTIKFLLSNPWRAGWLGVFLVAIAIGGMNVYQYTLAASIEDDAKTKCGAYGIRASIDTAHCIARKVLLPAFGYDAGYQMDGLDPLWISESGWRWNAINPNPGDPHTAAYGIPQALPGSKLGDVYCAHEDWRTNATCQMRWGLTYIKNRYGSPQNAWAFWKMHHWY